MTISRNYQYGANKPHQASPWRPGKPQPLYLCAILDSSARVIAVRSYPRATASQNVIEIPHEQRDRVCTGWTYDRKQKVFHP